jgi:hypothetical protein
MITASAFFYLFPYHKYSFIIQDFWHSCGQHDVHELFTFATCSMCAELKLSLITFQLLAGGTLLVAGWLVVPGRQPAWLPCKVTTMIPVRQRHATSHGRAPSACTATS